jgi:hypothetical protein
MEFEEPKEIDSEVRGIPLAAVNSPERKLIPAEDPTLRCQASGDAGEGQCKFTIVEGTKYCPKHAGFQVAKYKEKERVHDYRLQVWQERIDHFAESERVKTLRGEIGILRHTLEAYINSFMGDNQKLILYSGRISDLVTKIERLVVSCDKLETKFGMLLDKGAALTLAGGFVKIISNYIEDPAMIDKISTEMIELLGKVGIGSEDD